MCVSPCSLQVSRSVCQLAQQIGTDCTSLMPQIARHVVAELRSWLQLSNGSNEVKLSQTTDSSRHSVPMESGIVPGLRVATPITRESAGGRAAGASRCADRDAAGLVVAAVARQCSVHRVLRANGIGFDPDAPILHHRPDPGSDLNTYI